MITDDYLKRYLEGSPEDFLKFLEEKAQELQEESGISEDEARRRVAAIVLYHLRGEYFFMEQLHWYREQLDEMVTNWIEELTIMGENPITAAIPLKAVDRETARNLVMNMLRQYIAGTYPAWIISYVLAKNQPSRFFELIESWAGMSSFPNERARAYIRGEWGDITPETPLF
jgi:hypothetical protein